MTCRTASTSPLLGDVDQVKLDYEPFTPEEFDRWLQIFQDTVDGGWAGPKATRAKKRATGMAWAMAQRFLGKGAWRPAEHR
jgi:truncated hemoglobin YjbI